MRRKKSQQKSANEYRAGDQRENGEIQRSFEKQDFLFIDGVHLFVFKVANLIPIPKSRHRERKPGLEKTGFMAKYFDTIFRIGVIVAIDTAFR